MLSINLKARLENKTFWVSLVSAVVLLIQQCGLNASKFIPSNYVDIINSVFAILTILGIVIDTSTPGVNDQVTISNDTQANTNQDTNDTNTSETDSAAVDLTTIQTENEQLKAQLASIQSAVAGVINDSNGVTA
ncbi:phage holin [uncultured Clostridium sp.]|uniref:phage holin n=1 Tax=uncultured Clostridium sp. TaxID=59620 RepID=UPI0028E8C6CB|nr:phage holin [uncultured Clostridium sp.]